MGASLLAGGAAAGRRRLSRGLGQGQVVVHQLARRIEANYTRALPLVDELAAGAPDVARLREEVVHSTVVLDRFYERVGVDWLEPLRQDGVFATAPPLRYEEDGSVSYARWPQGRFLARVAPEAPDAVIERPGGWRDLTS